jgi:dipeptidyl aminopeptidase/acylaminoacyl peptidase
MPGLFEEVDVLVGEERGLPGTLTIPAGSNPVPGIILVHGSGPQDRDASLGPNKMFQDIAFGLGSRGIMVLRYDKRTLTHAAEFQDNLTYTVYEEVVDDVGEAIGVLAESGRVVADGVFVLGHSLGGFLVPRILEQFHGIAGGILLAANARPIHELMLEQIDYILSLDETTPEAKTVLDELQVQAQAIAHIRPNERPDVMGPLHVPISYWQDLLAYDPVQVAGRLHKPLLILQGGRDYQVTQEDFLIWQRGLRERSDVSCILYQNLHHLFMPSSTPLARPSSYGEAGHVDPAVLDDMAEWIFRHAHGPEQGTILSGR